MCYVKKERKKFLGGLCVDLSVCSGCMLYWDGLPPHYNCKLG